MGQTFLSTFLYLRIKMVGSMGGSGRKTWGALGSSKVSICRVMQSQTEIILTIGVHPGQGHVERYTL